MGFLKLVPPLLLYFLTDPSLLRFENLDRFVEFILSTFSSRVFMMFIHSEALRCDQNQTANNNHSQIFQFCESQTLTHYFIKLKILQFMIMKVYKVGCIFLMVILSDFCIEQYRDGDYREDALHFSYE